MSSEAPSRENFAPGVAHEREMNLVHQGVIDIRQKSTCYILQLDYLFFFYTIVVAFYPNTMIRASLRPLEEKNFALGGQRVYLPRVLW